MLASAVVVTYALTNYAPTMLAGLAIAVAIALFVFHSRLGLGTGAHSLAGRSFFRQRPSFWASSSC